MLKLKTTKKFDKDLKRMLFLLNETAPIQTSSANTGLGCIKISSRCEHRGFSLDRTLT